VATKHLSVIRPLQSLALGSSEGPRPPPAAIQRIRVSCVFCRPHQLCRGLKPGLLCLLPTSPAVSRLETRQHTGHHCTVRRPQNHGTDHGWGRSIYCKGMFRLRCLSHTALHPKLAHTPRHKPQQQRAQQAIVFIAARKRVSQRWSSDKV